MNEGIVLIARIGHIYHYPNSNQLFKLKEYNENMTVFTFECCHKVTDNVFIDLIHVDEQLKLF